jgi:hypothetical protein
VSLNLLFYSETEGKTPTVYLFVLKKYLQIYKKGEREREGGSLK